MSSFFHQSQLQYYCRGVAACIICTMSHSEQLLRLFETILVLIPVVYSFFASVVHKKAEPLQFHCESVLVSPHWTAYILFVVT